MKSYVRKLRSTLFALQGVLGGGAKAAQLLSGITLDAFGTAEVPASKAVGGDVDIQGLFGAHALHHAGEGGEQVVGVGGSGRSLGVVLHAEGGNVQEGDAFGSTVVEVDVG